MLAPRQVPKFPGDVLVDILIVASNNPLVLGLCIVYFLTDLLVKNNLNFSFLFFSIQMVEETLHRLFNLEIVTFLKALIFRRLQVERLRLSLKYVIVSFQNFNSPGIYFLLWRRNCEVLLFDLFSSVESVELLRVFALFRPQRLHNRDEFEVQLLELVFLFCLGR